MKFIHMRVINLILIVLTVLGYNYIIHLKELAYAGTTSAGQAETVRTDSSGRAVYRDGRWTGAGRGYGGEILVDVVIERGRISSIDIVSDDKEVDAYYEASREIVEAVLSEQTTHVDVVSEATFSAEGLLDAVDQALSQAER